MRSFRFASLFVLLLLIASLALAQGRRGGDGAPQAGASPDGGGRFDPTTMMFGGLRMRSIGPAVTSGRIADFAVDPSDRAKYFIAVASGGVWKTINAGTTWTPVFDNYGAFSIGDIALDPKDSNVL